MHFAASAFLDFCSNVVMVNLRKTKTSHALEELYWQTYQITVCLPALSKQDLGVSWPQILEFNMIIFACVTLLPHAG